MHEILGHSKTHFFLGISGNLEGLNQINSNHKTYRYLLGFVFLMSDLIVEVLVCRQQQCASFADSGLKNREAAK